MAQTNYNHFKYFFNLPIICSISATVYARKCPHHYYASVSCHLLGAEGI